MSPHSPTPAADPRESILRAAEERFRAYGFRKTTMSEIAADVGMSASNLYRFFDGKADLCRACARDCMRGRVETLRTEARRSGTSASERLREFTLANLRYTQEMTQHFPHIHELVEHVCVSHPELVHAHVDSVCSLLAEIIAHGNATGEFEVEDVWQSARSVNVCQIMFEVPLFMRLRAPEDFEAEARAVAELLVRGLARRA